MKKLLSIFALGLFLIAGCAPHSTSLSGLNLTGDEQFLQNMKPHHEEAIAAAQIIVEKSQNAELKALAQTIIDSQTVEVEQMKMWSQEWFGTELVNAPYMPMMRDLSELSGRELDTAFMKDMRTHHGMAIDMAKDILEITQRQEIKDMANAIITNQTAEIDQLSLWLE